MNPSKDDFERFCQEIPKLELHSHLNGSLSDFTLRELHTLQNNNSGGEIAWNRWETVIEHGEARTLEECFQIFDVAHSLTTSAKAIKVATRNTIKEFAEDGVVYLELRSTPREVAGIMSKAEYIQAVVEAIHVTDVSDGESGAAATPAELLDSSLDGVMTLDDTVTGDGTLVVAAGGETCFQDAQSRPETESSSDIVVKLLVSVNRQQGKAVAEDTLRVTMDAYNLYPSIVVGMDLSGNPSMGHIDDYLPMFSQAREIGLKIAIHTAEIVNDEEVKKILDFQPDRLGHATCIHPQYGGSEEIWQKLLESRIPIELCLTSNVKCKTVKSYEEHHFKDLFSAGHPITLATDDKGVFASNLSHEYQQAAKYYSLSKKQLWELSIKSVDIIFGSDEDKRQLMEIFQQKRGEIDS